MRLNKFSILSGLVALALAVAGMVLVSNVSSAKSEGSSDGLSRPHVGF